MTVPNENAGLPPVTPLTEGGEGKTEYEYDIMRIIERKNLEKVHGAKLIGEFESKIKQLFDYIPTHPDVKQLEAKIKAKNSSQE